MSGMSQESAVNTAVIDGDRIVADTNPSAYGGPLPPNSLRLKILRLTHGARYAQAEVLAHEWLTFEPLDVEVWNERAVSVWKQGRLAEAEGIFQHALRIDPTNHRLWTNLGHILGELGRNDDAIVAYSSALEHKSDSFDALMGLGVVISNQWKAQQAVPFLAAALQLRPNSAEALQNFGMNLCRMGRWHDAIVLYDEALRHRPDLAETHRNLAYALLMVGDYARGWPEHEWRLTFESQMGCRINRTFWNGDDFRNQSILLHFEQGFGDILQFIRYAPLVKRRGGDVVLLCPAPLLRLLARCEGVDRVYDGTGPEPDCHIQAPLLSLPAIFGTTLETVPTNVPYLSVDPSLINHWRSVLQTALNGPDEPGEAPAPPPFLIGIAWQGRPENQSDHLRSYPLAFFERIAALPNVRLVTLQVGHGEQQLADWKGRTPIIDLPGRRQGDFADTAAIMNLLDLVIAPDTAVSHLAGGAGIRAWLPISKAGDWRWLLDREDSPWYPTMRFFRQTTLGDWAEVFERIAQALEPELNIHAAKAI
jgi:Flp pilus assembly protein TadD